MSGGSYDYFYIKGIIGASAVLENKYSLQEMINDYKNDPDPLIRKMVLELIDYISFLYNVDSKIISWHNRLEDVLRAFEYTSSMDWNREILIKKIKDFYREDRK